MAAAATTRRFGYARVSFAFLVLALAALSMADLKFGALNPWSELGRLLRGLIEPDLLVVEARSIANTIAFAVLGVGAGASLGFVFALFFARLRAVRLVAAFLRSVHELFWALLLMQVWGLSPVTGVLAIALPYTGIFAKVFSEIIEEADLAAVRVLPAGTSGISVSLSPAFRSSPSRSATIYATASNVACVRPWCWASSACPRSASISRASSGKAIIARRRP